MRAFCTVSAPLEVCASSTEQLSPGSRFLALRFLGGQQPKTLYFLVDAKSRVREVYTQTCLHFATQGMLDTELFGLAVLIDGEYMFADPESKLSKYGPKSWRSSHTHGLDANGRPLLELHFRVQFYIESPFMLKDETSRHNYYLQLKYNALQCDLPREYSEQSMILLAGLALQADLGDAPITGSSSAKAKTTEMATTNITNTGLKDDGKGVFGNFNNTTNTKPAVKAKLEAMVPESASTAVTSHTTLPKSNKRLGSADDKVLRLSTYVAPTSQATSTTVTTTTVSLSSASPIKGNLKRSLGAVTASLSPFSSTLSINRGVGATTMSPTAKSVGKKTVSKTMTSTPFDYFRLEDYLPKGLRNAWAASALHACHRENRGMSVADAELHYIQQACLVHESINAHMFRMRMSKSEVGSGNSWFVVHAKGIKIFGAVENTQQQISFLWPNITKLSFERKKFEIRSGDNKITLYATSDEKNKMLLTLCKETHQFSMKIAARLKEVIKREEEESNCLQACYIYSGSLRLPYKSKNDQRISVISSTSSNTTSGIVSDRVHSEDELEIMINTPPTPIAAPSTESLALVHLLDHPSVSRQTSSVGQVSLQELEEQLVALTVRQDQRPCNSDDESPAELSNASACNTSSSGSIPTKSQRTVNTSTTTGSPNSQHNIGSQCSSTCSTVVVTSPSESNANGLASLTVNSATGENSTQRRNSTSSSLELGFSHTAQNSTLSEAESNCIPHGFIPSTQDDAESISGVYALGHGSPPTETSGVYTMHSSEMTGQSSEIAESEKSSQYGTYPPSKSEISDDHLHSSHPNLDLVDGGKRIKNQEFRLRSDSNVSTTGSFRGDGSDPTDKKLALLSAEELTELIVGRGTYPNRTTVASTLDSDCDYVTLPLSMGSEPYIQARQDTAPTEDVDALMIKLMSVDPPALPQRIDSTDQSRVNAAGLSKMRARSPPPYSASHDKTGLCGPPVRSSLQAQSAAVVTNASSPGSVSSATHANLESTSIAKVSTSPLEPTVAIRRRDPPPYSSSKRRPTSLISVSSTTPSLNYSNNALSTISGSMNSLKTEEVTARFITTRPQISILKAYTSVVNDNPKPSYAAPTNCSSSASSLGSVCGHHQPGHLTQHSLHSSSYIGDSQTSMSLRHRPSTTDTPSLSAAAVAHAAAAAAAGAGVIPSTIGIPIVPYSLHSGHKSFSGIHQQPPPPSTLYPEIKPPPRTCVLLPVIKPRQFLPPPPPRLPRQPPPPPPPQFSGVYNSQVARKQLELYQQQLYSDVDYVIYPIQDPAVSQQEYLDAKQGSILAAMAQTPSPAHSYLAYHNPTNTHAGTWQTCKEHAIYRSTPYLPLTLSTHSRYASTQNLSDTYVQLPSTYSPLYSPSVASLCSSYEPPPPLHPSAQSATSTNSSNLFLRSHSDDNILNSLDSIPRVKRFPPPPPPPYVNRQLKKPAIHVPTEKPPPIPSKPASTLRRQLPPRNLMTSHNQSHIISTSSGAQSTGERPKHELSLSRDNNTHASAAAVNRQQINTKRSTSSSHTSTTKSTGTSSDTNVVAPTSAASTNAFDIALLREKSKDLDLPLISALCNDRSLLKQTKILGNPKRSRNSSNTQCTTLEATDNTNNLTTTATTAVNATSTGSTANNSSNKCLPVSHVNGSSTPVTNTTTLPIAPPTTTTATTKHQVVSMSLSKPRKTAVSHRYPNDKLPPLPMQLAAANNYVMDPAILKHHKSFHSPT